MKNKLLWLLTFVPGIALAQNNYQIKGTLKGDSIKRVYLMYMNGYTPVTDSAEVKSGTYTLAGHVDVGQRAYLFDYNSRALKMPRTNGIAILFLSPGNINISHGSAFIVLNISGTSANETYKALQATAKPFDDELQGLRIKMAELLKQKDTIAANDVYAKIYALDQDYKEKVYGSFIKKNPQSPVAYFALMQLAGIGHGLDGQKLKHYFDLLPQHVKNSEDGRNFAKRINDAITFNTNGAIGSTAQNFTLPDTSGKPVSLSAYKGKYVLVDFWASWCSPCRADNPHLVQAYKRFHSKGFDILSVSLDLQSRKQAWLTAIDHDGLTAWTHVADLDHDTNAAVKLYGVQGIPQNFLIDPNGKIIGRSLRGGDLEKKLAEVLNH